MRECCTRTCQVAAESPTHERWVGEMVLGREDEVGCEEFARVFSHRDWVQRTKHYTINTEPGGGEMGVR